MRKKLIKKIIPVEPVASGEDNVVEKELKVN